MIIDKSSSEQFDLKTRLYQIVAESKISSLDMMSGLVGTDEEQVRSILEELVDEGNLEGSFTSDGQRFFLSEVKVSTAPVAESRDKGYVIETSDTKVPKLILISGIAMMVVGYLARGLITISAMMEHIGGAIFMVGLAVMIGGWLMISRRNPPSNIK
ncbi:MAG: hypothetical protein ACXAEF_12790 [Candidatus Thorarchaeota archaeon]|jgi:hypothetical protein